MALIFFSWSELKHYNFLILFNRILWIVVFFLGIVNASILSVEAYKLYKKYPILFSFQPFRVNTAKIPVPSVAISLSRNLKTEMIQNTLA